MENLRKSLLQAPIRFYRRLAQNIEHNGITDPNARARLGQAQLDLGELINQIGSVEDAIINFEQARDNLMQAVREVPGAAGYRFLLARATCFLANRYDKASRPELRAKRLTRRLPTLSAWHRPIPTIGSIGQTKPRRSSSGPTSCGITATSKARDVIISHRLRSGRCFCVRPLSIWR